MIKIQVISEVSCLFLCLRSSPEKLEEYIQASYKIRNILEEFYVHSCHVIYKPAYKLEKADKSSIYLQLNFDIL